MQRLTRLGSNQMAGNSSCSGAGPAEGGHIYKLILIAAVFFSQATAQTQRGTALPAVSPQRAERIRVLKREVVTLSNEDVARVTRGYVEEHLAKIRDIVQDQVLEVLAHSESEEDIRRALLAVLGERDRPEFAPGWPFVYSLNLKGLQAIVVAYDVRYGPANIPDSRVVIQAFRKAGSTYEVVGQTGESLDCELILEKLTSPRTNEAWFLAHGHHYGFRGQEEMIRLYSFDGYQFKELWAPAEPRISPKYKFTTNTITVTYEIGPIDGKPDYHYFCDTILLTDGGPVVSTTELP